MIFNNEYIIKFDERYSYDNFVCDNKPLFFFLGKPNKREINIKYVCAYCDLIKTEYGIYINNFKINENTIKGRKLKTLLNKNTKKSISLYRNIIKKTDSYNLSSVFIHIVLHETDESKIIDKKEKLDDIMIL